MRRSKMQQVMIRPQIPTDQQTGYCERERQPSGTELARSVRHSSTTQKIPRCWEPCKHCTGEHGESFLGVVTRRHDAKQGQLRLAGPRSPRPGRRHAASQSSFPETSGRPSRWHRAEKQVPSLDLLRERSGSDPTALEVFGGYSRPPEERCCDE